MKAHRFGLLFALFALVVAAAFAAKGASPSSAAPAMRPHAPRTAARRSPGADSRAHYPSAVIYVAALNPKASDSGSGSASSPFRTIQRAVDSAEANNAAGIATTINVRPGVYREDVQIYPRNGGTPAPLVLQGPTSDNAIVSATDVWTNWSKSGARLYSHPWPYRWGLTPLPSGWENAGATPITRRRETMFVNGRMPRQVLSIAELQRSKTPAFFVSEAAQTVYLKPPNGVNMARAVIEVGTRQRVLEASGQKNLTIKHLRFRGATSGFAPAAQLAGVKNGLLSHVTFGWNNWNGLSIYRSVNVTVVHSVFDHNGATGISGQENVNLVLEDDVNSYNNWRGAAGGMTLWENGMKLSSTHGGLIRDFVAIGNQAPGLWLDTDNRNVTIENSTLKHNGVYGVLLEANQGPITLRNNTVCGNAESGIVDGRSNHVTLSGNRSFRNGVAQLLFSGDPFVRSVTDWQTGVTTQVHSQDWTITRNTFAGSGSHELLTGAWGIPSSVWTPIASTMRAHANRWIQNGDARPFRIPGYSEPVNMGTWEAASGETGSTFSSSPSHLACP